MDLQIELAAKQERPQLRQLLADYLAELSRYGEVDLTYPYFDAYWDAREPRWPYLFVVKSRIVGFALVNTWSPSGRGADFAVAEFYVAPGARRTGVGACAARRLLTGRTGIWELSVMAGNQPARAFWSGVTGASPAEAVETIESGSEVIYRFVIR